MSLCLCVCVCMCACVKEEEESKGNYYDIMKTMSNNKAENDNLNA